MTAKPHEHTAGRARADGIAVFLSGACLVHCLLLPLAVTVLPIAQASLLEEQTFHLLMLLVILPTSLFALTIGCRQHRDRLTMIAGGTGLTILAITALFGHDLFGLTGERVVNSIGGVILAAAHIRNFLCCRADDCTHEHNAQQA